MNLAHLCVSRKTMRRSVCKSSTGRLQELFERAVLGDEVVERLLYRKEKKVYRHPKEIPFIAKQTRIVLENCGRLMQNPLTSTWHPAVSLPWKKRCLR